MSKTIVATTSLAGCFGCHMSLLDIDEKILDLIDHQFQHIYFHLYLAIFYNTDQYLCLLFFQPCRKIATTYIVNRHYTLQFLIILLVQAHFRCYSYAMPQKHAVATNASGGIGGRHNPRYKHRGKRAFRCYRN